MSILKRKGSRPAKQPTAEPLKIAALTRTRLVLILAAAGGRVTAEDIEADIAAGAPVNADGTIHLIHYTAWLASLAD